MGTTKTKIRKATLYEDGSERVAISYPESFGPSDEPKVGIYWEDYKYLSIEEAQDVVLLFTEALEFMGCAPKPAAPQQEGGEQWRATRATAGRYLARNAARIIRAFLTAAERATQRERRNGLAERSFVVGFATTATGSQPMKAMSRRRNTPYYKCTQR